MTTLEDVAALDRAEQGLAVVSTLRADQSIQSSLVDVGVLEHPLTGSPVLAFGTYGRVKLANLRARPQLTATIRLLLREIFVAAGGTHDDWDGYDATMLDQRRTAVLVEPARI
jgi:hypothetical protein